MTLHNKLKPITKCKFNSGFGGCSGSRFTPIIQGLRTIGKENLNQTHISKIKKIIADSEELNHYALEVHRFK
ncbi:hypothetical protein MNBD_BACTEROID01-2145 [hydrothermal vent metagenome]|uniref:Uncharacterized protein n=1 Tax=hydrothermal vent metagenome TaxID=652676 RepID=A0A3B0U0A2_9ZZZZ